MGDNRKSFTARFRDGETLLGTFIKWPSSHAAEILGDIGLDFAVIDQEHAEWPQCPRPDSPGLPGFRLAGLVRVPGPGASEICPCSIAARPACWSRM